MYKQPFCINVKAFFFWGGGILFWRNLMMSLYYEDCLRARYCKETGSSIHDFFFSFIEIDIDKFSIKVAFDPIM